MEKNYISLVIVLDEKTEVEKLFTFIEKITAFFAQHFENYEFIFVNNNAEKNLSKQVEKFFLTAD